MKTYLLVDLATLSKLMFKITLRPFVAGLIYWPVGLVILPLLLAMSSNMCSCRAKYRMHLVSQARPNLCTGPYRLEMISACVLVHFSSDICHLGM